MPLVLHRDLSASARYRLLTFAALYFAQGLPWGFVTVTVVLVLTRLGTDTATLGQLLALCYLPWALKPLFGPLVDRFGWPSLGRRRPWIIVAQAGMAICLLVGAGVAPQRHAILFVAVLFCHNLFAALQDVAVDSLAVDVLGAGERGRVNSAMWASKYAGVMAGGAGMAQVVAAVGLPALFLVQAMLVLGLSLFPLWLAEPTTRSLESATDGPAPRFSWRELWRSFGLRSTLVGAGFALSANIASPLATPVLIPLLSRRLHFSDATIGMLSGLLSRLAGAVGALLGGLLSDRLGRRRALFLYGVACAACYLAFAAVAPSWPRLGVVTAFVVLSNLCEGMLMATLLSLFMDLSNPRVGGTQFAIFAALTNLCSSYATLLGGKLGLVLAPAALFAVAGLAQLVVLAWLLPLDPSQAERCFRIAPPAAAPATAGTRAGGAGVGTGAGASEQQSQR